MARLAHVFAPKDREFFDLFEEAAANVVRGADLLDQMLAHYPDRSDLARDIVICEQEGDRITHDIHTRLNSTFVTPIDREDILTLTSALDDIIDLIDEVSDYLGLYKIEAPMEQAQRLAHTLLKATRQICEAMPRQASMMDRLALLRGIRCPALRRAADAPAGRSSVNPWQTANTASRPAPSTRATSPTP